MYYACLFNDTPILQKTPLTGVGLVLFARVDELNALALVGETVRFPTSRLLAILYCLRAGQHFELRPIKALIRLCTKDHADFDEFARRESYWCGAVVDTLIGILIVGLCVWVWGTSCLACIAIGAVFEATEESPSTDKL